MPRMGAYSITSGASGSAGPMGTRRMSRSRDAPGIMRYLRLEDEWVDVEVGTSNPCAGDVRGGIGSWSIDQRRLVVPIEAKRQVW